MEYQPVLAETHATPEQGRIQILAKYAGELVSRAHHWLFGGRNVSHDTQPISTSLTERPMGLDVLVQDGGHEDGSKQDTARLPADVSSATDTGYEHGKQPSADLYQFIQSQLVPNRLAQKRQALLSVVEADPKLREQRRLEVAIEVNEKALLEADSTNDNERRQHLLAAYDQLVAAQGQIDDSNRKRYRRINDTIWKLERGTPEDIVQANEPEGKHLLTALANAPPVQSVQIAQAPYAGQPSGAAHEQQPVTDEKAGQYLSELVFIQENELQYAIDPGEIVVTSDDGKPFNVPLNLIIHAANFTSWRGRPEHIRKEWVSKSGVHRTRSITAINDYASQPGDAPPVGEVRVMVQPNGTILCDNVDDGSHRIAAALLQGKPTIQASKLSFHLLNRNIIE